MKNYNIKIDDLLLHLLKEYHNIDASEAILFFSDRVMETKDLPPNITEKSRRATIDYKSQDKRTVQIRSYSGGVNHPDFNAAKFYVLRGFYPNTHVPFKLITAWSGSSPKPLLVKVIMGMKPHWTTISNKELDEYKNHVAEAALLEHEIKEENKIRYKYRGFKCMRPKGMELYHEINHEQKQKEKAAKRRRARNDK